MATDEKVYVGPDTLSDFKKNLARIECTASSSNLIGKKVTAVQGSLTVTETIDSNKTAILRLPKIGIWTISENFYNTSQKFQLPYYGDYKLMVGGDIFITVNYGPEFNYSTITITDGTQVISELTDSTGKVIFCVATKGTWTIQGVASDGSIYNTEVTCDKAGNYSVKLNASLQLNEWLEAGGLSPALYSTFDAVLADEKAVRKLMTKHDSVDLLAVGGSSDDNVKNILQNVIAAKWINLRDYAFDKLYSNSSLKVLMDETGLYGYGEIIVVNKSLIPTMTSNTTPSGTASNNSSNSNAYKAFTDEGFSDFYSNSHDEYVIYTFPSSQSIDNISLDFKTGNSTVSHKFRIYAKKNNTWVDVSGVEYENKSSDYKTYSIDCNLSDITAIKFQITYGQAAITTAYIKNFKACFGKEGYPKGNVPIMTSDTNPYGTVTRSKDYGSVDSKCYAYHVFDDTDGKWFISVPGSNEWLTYKFVNPVKVKRVMARKTTKADLGIISFAIKASNDNSTWTTLKTASMQNNNSEQIFEINNDNYYLYYRYEVTEKQGDTLLSRLQYYGRELSVSVPKMTSNTEPFGEAIASGYSSGHDKYLAFDDNNGTFFATQDDGEQWIGFDFGFNCVVKAIMYRAYDLVYGHFGNIKVQGYDGTKWDDVSEQMDVSNDSERKVYLISNTGSYKKYRIKADTLVSGGNGNIRTLQFYGLDYSEHAERHYIYDHGLEFEEIEQFTNSKAWVDKENDQIYLETNEVGNASMVFVEKDLTPYNLYRIKMGNKVNIGSNTDMSIRNRSTISSSFVAQSLLSYSNMPYNNYMDIKNTNGTYCIVCTTNGGSNVTKISIKEWWLE